MAEHVWSVLCYQAVIDRDRNNVSLLSVIEQLKVEESQEEITERISASGAAGIELKCEFIASWVRSDHDSPEEGLMRLVLIPPSGEEVVTGEAPINLTRTFAFRQKYQLDGIPWRGFGIYWFVTEQKVGSDWRIESRVPLDVLMSTPELKGKNPTKKRRAKK